MRIERASVAPSVPWWAVVIVCIYLLLVGVHTLIGWHRGAGSPPLCLFHALTGRPCPTCGTTRMVLAIAHGNLREAAASNPLMFAVGIVVLGLAVLRIGCRRRVVWITSARSRGILAAALVMAILANWVYLLKVF
jgi:hypothetical protein